MARKAKAVKVVQVAPICEIHHKPKVMVKDQWYCKDCLYSSFLTYETQKEAVKRWRESEKGKQAEKAYEQSDKGKETRNKYLKGDKYKAARKVYNEHLKQSLAIARLAKGTGEGAKAYTGKELSVASSLEGLLAEIREYLDSNSRPPTVQNVIQTAKRDYGTVIDAKKAEEMIAQASSRGKR